MDKSTFKKQYPDVCMQKITTPKILTRREIETKVIQIVENLETGLLAYESSGREVKVFTSLQFANKLKTMTKDSQILDENTGLVGTITSDKPFVCSCEMCVRVDFGEWSDVYACTYF